MARPVVYVCRGSDCRSRKRRRRALLDALSGVARVEETRCQKVCKGVVAGVEVGGTLHWFERVDGRGERKALVRLLGGDELPRRLGRRSVKDRLGKLRT